MPSEEQELNKIFSHPSLFREHSEEAFSLLGKEVLLSSEDHPLSYLAAAQTVHLLEGWQNFSAAFSDFLLQRPEQGLHMAYYAELRAAMSIFASLGINVQHTKNFYLDENLRKQTLSINGGTHKLTWKLWEKLLKTSNLQRLLQREIYFMLNINLETVLENLMYTDINRSITDWSSDLLLQAKNDHMYRNIVSYSIRTGKQSLRNQTYEDFQLFLELWRCLLNDGSVFYFDKELTKYFIDQSYKNHNSLSVDIFNENLSLSLSESSGESQEIILRNLKEPSNYLVFQHASSKNFDFMNVLCRAFCMLKIATIAYKSMSIPSQKIAPWFTQWLINYGYREELNNEMIIDDYLSTWEDFKCIDQENFTFQKLWSEEFYSGTKSLLKPTVSLLWEFPKLYNRKICDQISE